MMLTAVLAAIVVLLWLAVRPLYWWRRGVVASIPLPLFGSCLPALYLSSVSFFQRLYQSKDRPYFGIFFFTRPALLLKDPQVIMEILENKMPYFSSHGVYVNKERDPMGKSLFHISGREWKEARSKMSPHFSPAKVKSISETAEKSVNRLLNYLENKLDKDVNIHSAAMKLSIDVTAATLFGLESNVFQEGEQSVFFSASKDLNTPQSMFKVFLSFVSPVLFDVMNLKSFSTKTNKFIINMVYGAMEVSKRNPNVANFIQGMVQLLENDKNFDSTFALSQGAILWTGGVETTAATLGFCLFELAADVCLQEQLRRGLSTSEGRQLLRHVVAETLRKYPPFSILTRCCTEDCTLDSGLTLEKGTLLIIPVFSIQHDSNIYPEPEAFKPCRDRPKGAYLPFGSGPRTCLGMKMAESVLELTLSKLLQKYRFLPSTKSQRPVKISPRTFFTTAEGGLWVKIKKI